MELERGCWQGWIPGSLRKGCGDRVVKEATGREFEVQETFMGEFLYSLLAYVGCKIQSKNKASRTPNTVPITPVFSPSVSTLDSYALDQILYSKLSLNSSSLRSESAVSFVLIVSNGG